MAAPHPDNDKRVKALLNSRILDTEREADFDEIVELIAKICDVPFAVVNFIDINRQWFKAEVGLGTRELPLDESICAHAILLDDYMEIPDTLEDPRMATNPLCLGAPNLRFYAGALLKTTDGLPLGTLCVLDSRPRTLDDLQRESLKVMARQVMRQLDLRQSLRQAEVLRQEVDHRVKNSLQSVASLARIHARRLEDENARDAMTLMVQRVEVIADLHRALYETSAEERITLSDYLTSVADLLRRSLPPSLTLTVAADCGDATVSSKEAGSVGLIVAELSANAVKHGFPDGTPGQLTLSIDRAQNGALSVALRDNGAGSAAVSEVQGSGLGNTIIAMLAQQLDGEISTQVDASGYHATLRFHASD
ncbi:hypothetical protein A8B78_06340 [Jannaschia sp. EhC01]|nr:hypothetical protein A8B78_06340 [Jannaschia sp. EhC01]